MRYIMIEHKNLKVLRLEVFEMKFNKDKFVEFSK